VYHVEQTEGYVICYSL